MFDPYHHSHSCEAPNHLWRPVRELRHSVRQFWRCVHHLQCKLRLFSGAVFVISGALSSSPVFNTVAYLQQIWWFEVDGEVSFPFPADIYTLSFRLHLGRFSKRLGRRVCNYEQVHGWHIKPVRFELSTLDGQRASFECCLDETEHDDAHGNHKRGHWVDYKVGEFIVNGSEPTSKVRFSMKQIDCTHSKGGLCVDSVFIIPSDLRERKRSGSLK